MLATWATPARLQVGLRNVCAVADLTMVRVQHSSDGLSKEPQMGLPRLQLFEFNDHPAAPRIMKDAII